MCNGSSFRPIVSICPKGWLQYITQYDFSRNFLFDFESRFDFCCDFFATKVSKSNKKIREKSYCVIHCSQPFRQIDTIGRQAPSIEYNAQLVAGWFQLDTVNMYSCFWHRNLLSFETWHHVHAIHFQSLFFHFRQRHVACNESREREASKVSKLPESLTFLAEQIRSYLDSTLADLLYVKSFFFDSFWILRT